ncbi:Glycogen debranching enzyme [Lachnospiraceae bacterium TWA4]|nr:Glycogen debranching enzyme [Lachnospiraceae bacterium TWA4]
MNNNKLTVIPNNFLISPYPLGAHKTSKGIRFSVEAPTDAICELVLYYKAMTDEPIVFSFPTYSFYGNIRVLIIAGLEKRGWSYHFRINGKDLPDPYGRNFIGTSIWADVSRLESPYRTLIIEDSFNWEEDNLPNHAWNDLFIYRLHVRGFTIHKSSKVRNKGTFAGVVEKLPYLQSIGVTAIELMPVYEFEEIEQTPLPHRRPTGQINYWGYTSSHYYAPKASYAGKSSKGFAPTAFKELVKAFHKAGIEVFLEFFFTKETPAWMALDILRYWKITYHIDGFRILGHANLEAIAGDPLFANTRLFADNWTNCEKQTHNLAISNIGFQTDIRRFLRGDEGMIGSLSKRMRENSEDLPIVHYLASNNGFTLKDTFTYEKRHNEINGEQNRDGMNDNYSFNCGEEGPSTNRLVNHIRKSQIFNALTLLFLSQSIPLIQSGDEMGRTQYGNNNAWCQDNTISWIDWKDLRKNKEVFNFFQFIVNLRKNHLVFHNSNVLTQTDPKGYGIPDISFHGLEPWRPNFDPFCRQCGILYSGQYACDADGNPDYDFYLLCNMYWIPSEFLLPRPKKGI